MANSNKLIEQTTGIENVAQIRYNYENTKAGKPRNSDIVDSTLKDL